MNFLSLLLSYCFLMPAGLMFCAALLGTAEKTDISLVWKRFNYLSTTALVFSLVALLWQLSLFFTNSENVGINIAGSSTHNLSWLKVSQLSVFMALLVQLLGVIIGFFSSRYLQGESGQHRYISALVGVLASVHILLLANHWIVLIVAWTLVGIILQKLLCFYQDRPFALLAAHKKRVTDRLADVLLILAAALAWQEVGSGIFSDLWIYLAQNPISLSLQISAVCLVSAVILRTALLPVHGWLIQVMEAPTPVSALLHAGVINLGGFVLIRFASFLEAATAARWILVCFGFGTALLAGLVMLTRISIKVRLAWSTVAQMGFMIVECALGLYTIAAMHLIGHSLYKASAFLSASTTVQQTKLKIMREPRAYSTLSLFLAPIIAFAVLVLIQIFVSYIKANTGNTGSIGSNTSSLTLVVTSAWPIWWSGVLAFAWSPLLWFSPLNGSVMRTLVWQLLTGCILLILLTTALQIGHILPFALHDAPDNFAGIFVLCGMTIMYFCIAILQIRSATFIHLRRWGYAGFYIDEIFTRLTLRFLPTHWSNQKTHVATISNDQSVDIAAAHSK